MNQIIQKEVGSWPVGREMKETLNGLLQDLLGNKFRTKTFIVWQFEVYCPSSNFFVFN